MIVTLAGAGWVLPLAGGMLVVSTLLIMWRLLIGPSRPDRAVAVDALTMIGVAGVAVLAMMSEQAVLLDVAIVLATVSFLGSVAFALLFTGTHSSDNPHGQPGGRPLERKNHEGEP
ncbi:monovalent cation/H+ antiporter complex subunit F [Halopseudomonas pelagia]|uniref:PH regulation protein F n=1 Tax=Halopseudomonas pelagia TaxID=553151 RepID=A0AA91TZ88_9GAMM|nr:monovalent cation/H+ antiporter complex subunit F [Halopseudomonas pelagia]PCC97588.1 pH regulation protein F [Halopseudomonas pelagia]QFY57903.1 pH regulation protein F [Halopseudomonas pelagia]